MDLEMRNILHAYTLPDTEIKTELEEVFCSNESPEVSCDPESLIQKQEEEKQTLKLPNKRKKPPEKLIIKKSRENVLYEQDSDSDREEDYSLCVPKVPEDVEASDVVKQLGVGDRTDINESRDVKMEFCDTPDFDTAIKKEVEERLIRDSVYIKSTGNDAEFNDDTSLGTEVSTHSLMVPDKDLQSSDPLGLYGLKLEFLESLGITPPLDRWVQVTNFRCDKFELRDVMELAGHVLSCSLITINRRYAKVQYSHPLEAVQAVSMLNGQMYFGLPLKICLEKNLKNDVILPKGLVNIGLGLGLQGRPVRDIVKQYKRYAKQQKSEVNPIIFRKVNDEYRFYSDDNKINDRQMDVAQFVASSRTSTFTNDRPFNIKHVEDLDNNDDGKDKSTISPESHSDKSVGSPVSNHVVREDKPNDLKVTSSSAISLQHDAQGNSALPLSLSRGNTGVSVPRSNIPQNRPFRPQMSPAVPYRPCPPVPQLQQANVQYTGPFKPGPFCNAVPNHIPNSLVNQPNQGPIPLPLSYAPISAPGPSGSGPIIRPGAVHIPRPGPINGPGTITAPVPVSGSSSVTGSIAVTASGPGPASIRGPGIAPGQAPRPVLPSSSMVHGSPTVPAIGSVTSSRPGPVSVVGPGGAVNGKFAVQLANLPPSTTFPFLCEKLSHCGQMLSLQFTTPGCAVAAFSHPAHAERCFQTFNAMTVEGYRISVTLV